MKIKKLVCPKCKRKISRVANFNRHMKTHDKDVKVKSESRKKEVKS